MNAQTGEERIKGLCHHHPYCKLLTLMKVMTSPNICCVGIPWRKDLVKAEDDRCHQHCTQHAYRLLAGMRDNHELLGLPSDCVLIHG